MNRGVLQSEPVQQMMAGNPTWWSINNMKSPPQQPSPLLPPPSFFPQYSSAISTVPSNCLHDTQDLPESWSQLLLGGLMGEEDRAGLSHFQAKRFENWDEQVMYPSAGVPPVDIKQEVPETGYVFGHGNEEFQAARSNWSPVMPVSSPRSCVTSFSSNMLDFSNSRTERRHQQADHSPECNSTSSGGAFKKARVQTSSTQTSIKVRKEKLGDRITALHQLVSPFGKTDTASVLLEAIGYIRFLQSQIEALSSPYLGSGSGNTRQQQSVQGERNCLFPEDPGQLLNDNCMERRGASKQDAHDAPKDLRSRGLCLVPLSCTLQVGSDNGADFWASTFGGGFR